MPRYYFNVRRGPDKLTVDLEGDDLADASLVRPHALRVARAVVKTRSHGVRDWMVCAFEVVDEARQLVEVVPFGDIVVDASGDV